jgi:hypothetical protein
MIKFITNDDEITLNVSDSIYFSTYPTKLPTCDEMSLMTSVSVDEYFKDIQGSKFRIFQINGFDLQRIDNSTCDGCRLELNVKYGDANVYYSNGNDDYCVACYEKLSSKDGLFKVDPDDNIGYGSMMNWFPLYVDSDRNYICQNLNLVSKHYLKYSIMSADNHGRYGCCIVDTKLYPTLEKILTEIKNLSQWLETTGADGWNEFYNSPIKKLMEQHGCDTHYG